MIRNSHLLAAAAVACLLTSCTEAYDDRAQSDRDEQGFDTVEDTDSASFSGDRMRKTEGTALIKERDSEEKGVEMTVSKEISLSKEELENIIPGSKFLPHSKRSLATKFSFLEGGRVVLSSSGEGMVYDQKYYAIRTSDICIDEDEDHSDITDCIKFSRQGENLYQLSFANKLGAHFEEKYLRVSNHEGTNP